MPYSLQIKNSALKELKKIDRSTRKILIEEIDKLAENPHVGRLLKGEFSGLRRIRVGSYRIIYEIDEGKILILILRIAHRKTVYR